MLGRALRRGHVKVLESDEADGVAGDHDEDPVHHHSVRALLVLIGAVGVDETDDAVDHVRDARRGVEPVDVGVPEWAREELNREEHAAEDQTDGRLDDRVVPRKVVDGNEADPAKLDHKLPPVVVRLVPVVQKSVLDLVAWRREEVLALSLEQHVRLERGEANHVEDQRVRRKTDHHVVHGLSDDRRRGIGHEPRAVRRGPQREH